MMRYLDRYTPEQMRRREAPPGLTGLARVRGRNHPAGRAPGGHRIQTKSNLTRIDPL